MLNLFGQHHPSLCAVRTESPYPIEVTPHGGIIPPGVSLIHFITWKFILIHITLKSIKNQPFMTDVILTQIRRRVNRKIDSAREGLRIEVVRADARGTEPKVHRFKKWIRGIGTIENSRTLKLYPEIALLLE